MEEPQDIIWKNFGVKQKHIEFLEKINENISLALRTVLDKSIRDTNRTEIKTTVDQSMWFICFGLLFFVLSFLLDGFIVVIPMLIGIAVLMYGLIGGVSSALSRTRR